MSSIINDPYDPFLRSGESGASLARCCVSFLQAMGICFVCFSGSCVVILGSLFPVFSVCSDLIDLNGSPKELSLECSTHMVLAVLPWAPFQ